MDENINLTADEMEDSPVVDTPSSPVPFKILKGEKKDFNGLEYNEGTMYYCTDTGELFIAQKNKENQIKTEEIGRVGKDFYIDSNGEAVFFEEHGEIFNDYINNRASGNYSHAEGFGTTASGRYSHAEGSGSEALEFYSHAEGWSTEASGKASHAEGTNSRAFGNSSHAEGYNTEASNVYSHAEGNGTKASGENSHTEGYIAKASGKNSHAEGSNTEASGAQSHAEGIATKASGTNSHAEGQNTEASGNQSHAEGVGTKATTRSINVIGEYNDYDPEKVGIVDYVAHSASKPYSVNARVWVIDSDSIEYNGTMYEISTSRQYIDSVPTGAFFVDNNLLTTSTIYEFVRLREIYKNNELYQYNISYRVHQLKDWSKTQGDYLHVVGNGTSNSNRKNAHTLDWNGNAWFAGDVYVSQENGDTNTNKTEDNRLLTSREVNDKIGVVDNRITTEVNTINESIDSNVGELTAKIDGDVEAINQSIEDLDNSKQNNVSGDNGQMVIIEDVLDESGNVVGKDIVGAYRIGREGTNIGAEIFNHYYDSEDGSVRKNIASGTYSHSEGYQTSATGNDGSHAEGILSKATGTASHAEGYGTASGAYSHAEGYGAKASGLYSHAEGDYTIASGARSHAEGANTVASGSYSHAEGYGSIAIGHGSHAEGASIEEESPHGTLPEISKTNSNKTETYTFDYTTANGIGSHAEGVQTYADGYASHSEGFQSIAINKYSHAEGESTKSEGIASHAEGAYTTAFGECSHAEGRYTTASNYCSHAEGHSTEASGPYSHAEGHDTQAKGENQHVQGILNIVDNENKYAHIVGNGKYGEKSARIRSNAHTLDWTGNAWFAGDVYVGGDVDTNGKITNTNSKKLATEERVNNLIHIGGTLEEATDAAKNDGAILWVDKNSGLKYWDATANEGAGAWVLVPVAFM